MKKRLIGLDLFRIGAAAVIFLFHSHMHIHSNYGFLNNFISMGAVFMTGFFMLSGFSMYYVYQGCDFTKLDRIVNFYKKRAVGILPNYYLVALLYVLIIEKDYLLNIIIAPIELFGIQTVFTSLFPFSHNSGTWFISGILICYALFPFLCTCLDQFCTKTKSWMLGLLTALLLYAPIVVLVFQTADIYSNSFFRFLEFMIGALISSLLNKFSSLGKLSKILASKWLILTEGLSLVAAISLAVSLKWQIDNYMMYSWIVVPFFSLMMISLAIADVDIFSNSKTVLYLSKISYAFFLVQFFVWPLIKEIEKMFGYLSNPNKIIASLALCLILAMILFEAVEKPIRILLLKKTAVN